jgi:hypothetical protein
MNTWVSFNLYIATGVLIEGCHTPETSQESRSNLEFLLKALQVIGRKHIVTQAFIAQLKTDLEIAGINSPFDETFVSFYQKAHTCCRADVCRSGKMTMRRLARRLYMLGRPILELRKSLLTC